MNICSVEWCETEVVAKKMCMKHYQRFRRNGTTEPKFYKGDMPIEKYFNKLFNKSGYCWEWIGLKTDFGYGIVPYYFTRKYNEKLAHRVSYLINKGSLPKWEGYKSKCVLHICDNPACVNPDHLFLGTHTDNMRDMHNKGRGCVGEKHRSSKFTEKEIVKIRERLNNGERAFNLAKEYKVTARAMYQIRDKRTWKSALKEKV